MTKSAKNSCATITPRGNYKVVEHLGNDPSQALATGFTVRASSLEVYCSFKLFKLKLSKIKKRTRPSCEGRVSKQNVLELSPLG
jgi:hypothetical protein